MAEVLSSTTRGNGYRLSQGKIRLKKRRKSFFAMSKVKA